MFYPLPGDFDPSPSETLARYVQETSESPSETADPQTSVSLAHALEALALTLKIGSFQPSRSQEIPLPRGMNPFIIARDPFNISDSLSRLYKKIYRRYRALQICIWLDRIFFFDNEIPGFCADLPGISEAFI